MSRKRQWPKRRGARAFRCFRGGRHGRLQKGCGGEAELPLERGEELLRSGGLGGALFGADSGEGLRELRIAVLLAGCGGGEGLLRGGELRGEPGAVATVVAPGDEQDRSERGREDDFSETKSQMKAHGTSRGKRLEASLQGETECGVREFLVENLAGDGAYRRLRRPALTSNGRGGPGPERDTGDCRRRSRRAGRASGRRP